MQDNALRNKSDMLIAAADLLHDKSYYLAVAHAAYYSCYQLLKYIWRHHLSRSQDELDVQTSQSRLGSHEFLLNEIVKYISGLRNTNSEEDARILRNDLPQLKRLRTDADYGEAVIGCEKSKEALDLSKKLLLILKRYL